MCFMGMLQYIVEHGGPHQTLVLKFDGRIIHMSHQKHSSNVIEKCLKYGGYHDRNVVITEILSVGGGQTDDHLLLLKILPLLPYMPSKNT